MHPPKPEALTLDLPFISHDTSHSAHAIAGEMTFASPEAQAQRTSELLGAGAMVVVVSPPAPAVRGRLAERLDDVVERELGARGAPSPYLTEWSGMPDDAEERLADQLFRARTVGATGIAISLGSLSGIARPALSPEDSSLLRVLAKATSVVPLVVMMDDGDEQLAAYAPPVALSRMLGADGLAGATLDEPEATDAASSETLATELPVIATLATELPVIATLATELPEIATRATETLGPDMDAPEVDGPEMVETAVDAKVAPLVADVATAAVEVQAVVQAVIAVEVQAVVQAVVAVEVEAVVEAASEDREPVPEAAWRSWAIALDAARGPQPLGAFERLFTERYMPLSRAIASGVDDPLAIRVHDEFRQGFERSYTDAFATFGATGRRPRLVMDAFDAASKQARMHNARLSHVLVVDAMRYDLGELVRDRMAERAGSLASLTSDSLMWSALPTTTFRQLETLARGMDALRAPSPDEVAEIRGGLRAETVRRLRVGSRELYKLDVVPAMLGAIHEPGVRSGPTHVLEAFEGIASAVADALVRHLATLAPRTMLLVVGDHGFCVDRKGRITQGGASPEEVLVPCFTYLVADLH